MALIGALHQMEVDGLLGTCLYFGGVSGSTWWELNLLDNHSVFSPNSPSHMCSSARSMAFLYSDPEWSTNMSTSVTRLSTSEVSLEETLAWLGRKAKDEDFSLTHVWGALTSAGIMKQVRRRPGRVFSSNRFFAHDLSCLPVSWTCGASRATLAGTPPIPTPSTAPLRDTALRTDQSRVSVFLGIEAFTWMSYLVILLNVIRIFLSHRSVVRGHSSRGWLHGDGAFC